MKTKRLVQGVGINDADYVVRVRKELPPVDGKRRQKLIWSCPYYDRWCSMLERCFSKRYREREKSYQGVTCCDRWLTFSTFKRWMEVQDWEGKVLDKDLLVFGNKVYSPETCIFISCRVNTVTLKYPKEVKGYYQCKKTGKYIAQVSNLFSKKMENLGYYSSCEEARAVFLLRKKELIQEVIYEEPELRVKELLINRFSYLPLQLLRGGN